MFIGVDAIPDKTSVGYFGTSQVILEFFLDKECTTIMTGEGKKTSLRTECVV